MPQKPTPPKAQQPGHEANPKSKTEDVTPTPQEAGEAVKDPTPPASTATPPPAEPTTPPPTPPETPPPTPPVPTPGDPPTPDPMAMEQPEPKAAQIVVDASDNQVRDMLPPEARCRLPVPHDPHYHSVQFGGLSGGYHCAGSAGDRPDIAPFQPPSSLPDQIAKDMGPPQYADGEPFQMIGDENRFGYNLLGQVGRLVDRPAQDAASVDLDRIAIPDEHLDSFVVLQGDVWEEVWPDGTTSIPNYVMKFPKGARVPAQQIQGLRVRAARSGAGLETK